MERWLTVALQILFQEHVTHLLQPPMQASPASSLVCLQLLLRVQIPGMVHQHSYVLFVHMLRTSQVEQTPDFP